jgi:hypothetical protein
MSAMMSLDKLKVNNIWKIALLKIFWCCQGNIYQAAKTQLNHHCLGVQSLKKVNKLIFYANLVMLLKMVNISTGSYFMTRPSYGIEESEHLCKVIFYDPT